MTESTKCEVTAIGYPVIAPTVPPPPGFWFSDDDGSRHEGAIEALAAARIASGCGRHLYCPAEETTRGQFASLLARAFPDLVPDYTGDFFGDDNGSVHEADINRLAAVEIAAGCGPSRFCPDDPIRRDQAATLLARALPGLAPPERDHFSDDDGSIHEIAVNAMAENGILAGCGPSRFCPDDPIRRDQAATLLARVLNLNRAEPQLSLWRLELVADGIVGGFTDLQAPIGDDRAFLATRRGMIRVMADGALLPGPFLDLTSKISGGLFGLAFHPRYDTNGKFYVFYIALDGNIRIYEYRADSENPNRADPSTARHIVTIERDTSTHHGGQLQFGPDGYLYIGIGDNNNPESSQNLQTAHGTILRIDVDNGEPYSIPADNPFADGQDGLPEVWAYGLRHPWRFSFDGPNIYIADVGDVHIEEINIAKASQGGINYGSPVMDGSICVSPTSNCAGLFTPQIEYYHAQGFAVIGGYVYRGTALPEMVGRYFYSDYTGAWIRTFLYNDDGEVTEHYDWSSAVENVAQMQSFGKDGHGELYVLTGYAVYKIVPR